VTGAWESGVTVCETPTAVAEAAAARFATTVEAAVARRQVARVALAGGRTPESSYRLLAEAPYREAVPWDAVVLFWGDERCVPREHPDSNYRMAREALLSRVPIPETNIHRIRGGLADSLAAARAYEDVLRRVCRVDVDTLPRLDLCLLGLGADGHTASLFPGSPAIREQRKWVAAGWVEKFHAWRLTLTPPVFNNSRNVLFLVTGAEKADTVRAVLEGPRDPDHIPAQIIRPPRGRLEWLLDRAAASRLSPSAPYHQPVKTATDGGRARNY
jgi:6-phosphogluconolactonase